MDTLAYEAIRHRGGHHRNGKSVSNPASSSTTLTMRVGAVNSMSQHCEHVDHIRLGPTEEDYQRWEVERGEFVDRMVARILKGVKEPLMPVRCKFVCSFKEGQNVHFSPVYSGSEENKKFFQATPGGQIAFYTVNESALDQFEQGKEYYVDFTPADNKAVSG